MRLIGKWSQCDRCSPAPTNVQRVRDSAIATNPTQKYPMCSITPLYPTRASPSTHALKLPLDVPHSLLQVLFPVFLPARAPEVLHGVPETEAHVLRDLDTLNAGRVVGVVGWMVYWVSVGHVPSISSQPTHQAHRKVEPLPRPRHRHIQQLERPGFAPQYRRPVAVGPREQEHIVRFRPLRAVDAAQPELAPHPADHGRIRQSPLPERRGYRVSRVPEDQPPLRHRARVPHQDFRRPIRRKCRRRPLPVGGQGMRGKAGHRVAHPPASRQRFPDCSGVPPDCRERGRRCAFGLDENSLSRVAVADEFPGNTRTHRRVLDRADILRLVDPGLLVWGRGERCPGAQPTREGQDIPQGANRGERVQVQRGRPLPVPVVQLPRGVVPLAAGLERRGSVFVLLQGRVRPVVDGPRLERLMWTTAAVAQCSSERLNVRPGQAVDCARRAPALAYLIGGSPRIGGDGGARGD